MSDYSELIDALREKREALDQAIAALEGLDGGGARRAPRAFARATRQPPAAAPATPGRRGGGRRRRRFSAEARRRMAESQRLRRERERKAAGKQ